MFETHHRVTPRFAIDRDPFVAALSRWLRWRGHTLPHDVFSERFPLSSGTVAWEDLVTAGKELGLGFAYRPADGSPPAEGTLPLIALLHEGHVALVRGVDPEGQLITVDEEGKPSPLAVAAVRGWVQTTIEARRLHEEIFGVTGAERDWFWKPFLAHRWAYVQGALAAALINIFAIAGSLYSMQVYDRVLPSDSRNTLLVLTVGVLMIYVIDLVLRSVRAYVLDYVGKRMDASISEKVFDQAVGIRMEARPPHTGTFIGQLREHETLREFFMSSAIFTLSDIPFLVIFLIVIWIIGGSIVLIPLATIPILVGAVVLLQLPLGGLARRHVKEGNARSGLLIEAVEGSETLKTLNAEWRLGRRWRELTDLVGDTSLRMKTLTNFGSTLTATGQQVMYVFVIAYGAILVHDGLLTAGALMACSILASRALGPLATGVGHLIRLHHIRASSRIVDQIMALPVDRPVNAGYLAIDRPVGEIRMTGVEFSYGTADVPALRIANLNIKPGERVAVLGRTGSGKSTLLRLLSGLYRPSRGRIYFDGVDIHQIDPTRYRKFVGYITQDVRLFSGTLRENLILGAGEVSDDFMLEIARITGIDRFIAQHPRGFDLPIYEGGGGLSGGQRQAVGLARLMLGRPGAFLFDEPTASMDQQTEAEFIDRFGKFLTPQHSLIIVTHKPSILALVNRIVVLDQGQVVIDGPRDEVIARLNGAPSRAASPQTPQASPAPQAAQTPSLSSANPASNT